MNEIEDNDVDYEDGYWDYFNRLTVDEKIDMLLKFISEQHEKQLNHYQLRMMYHFWGEDKSPQQQFDFSDILWIMKDEELFLWRQKDNPHNPLDDVFPSVTLKGYRILDQGGWLKHIARLNEERNTIHTMNKTIKISSFIQAVFAVVTTIFIVLTFMISREAMLMNESKSTISIEELKLEELQLRLLMMDRVHHSSPNTIEKERKSIGKTDKVTQ